MSNNVVPEHAYNELKAELDSVKKERDELLITNRASSKLVDELKAELTGAEERMAEWIAGYQKLTEALKDAIRRLNRLSSRVTEYAESGLIDAYISEREPETDLSSAVDFADELLGTIRADFPDLFKAGEK